MQALLQPEMKSHRADTRPSYFFLFKLGPYFPGFADCGPSSFVIPAGQRAPAGCLEIQKSRLNKNFLKVLDTSLFSVFDLNQIVLK